MPGLI